MDKYKITQSGLKQQLAKPLISTKKQIKRINSQKAVTLILAAVVLISLGVLIAFLTLRGKPKPTQTSSGSLQSSSQQAPNISAAAFDGLTTGVANKNLSILGSYCAPKVHVIIVSSGINKTLSCDQAESLINSAIQGATNPWNFHLPAADISAWQRGPYGQQLNGTNIIGESSNGEVISIGFNSGGQVTTVIVVPVGSLTPSPTNSATPNPSGSSTSSPTQGSSTTNLPPGNPVPAGGIVD